MNTITVGLYNVLFLDSEGGNRQSPWTKMFHRLWTMSACSYLERQRRKLPNRTMLYLLEPGKEEIVKQWYYDYLPGCPDSAGYFSIALSGESLVVRSLCEKDHPGPSAKDCLYINGQPFGRNESRRVEWQDEIVIIDYADRHKSINSWEKSFIRILAARNPDLHKAGRRRR